MDHESYKPSTLLPSDEDIKWLVGLYNSSDLLTNTDNTTKLSELVELGSIRLDKIEKGDLYVKVIEAREQFFSLVGIDERIINEFRKLNPTLIPLDTYINSQRVMDDFGLDAVKVINVLPTALSYAPESIKVKLDNLSNLGLDTLSLIKIMPAALCYAPESVKAKFDNLTNLGLDAVKIINASPWAITLAPESVKAKVDNLTSLGLDAKKIINANPAAINLAPESVKAKVDNLTSLGLDAVKVINVLPTALCYAPESVKAKVDNLSNLGLDAKKIINSMPSTISLASESVRAKFDNLTNLGLDAKKIINANPVVLSLSAQSVKLKVHLLERYCSTFNWNGSATQIITEHPRILGFNNKKLAVLARIALEKLSFTERSAPVKQVRNSLNIPLEKYIIALNGTDSSVRYTLMELKTLVQRVKENKSERREQAIAVSAQLGDIGISYLRYRKD